MPGGCSPSLLDLGTDTCRLLSSTHSHLSPFLSLGLSFCTLDQEHAHLTPFAIYLSISLSLSLSLPGSLCLWVSMGVCALFLELSQTRFSHSQQSKQAMLCFGQKSFAWVVS